MRWLHLVILRLAGSNPAEGIVSQVEVSGTDWSLVQKSSPDCDASLCVILKP